MTEKEINIPISRILPLPDEKGTNKHYIDIIINEDIPIVCINKSAQKKRIMPFKALYDNNEQFWQQKGNWEYYLTKEGFETFKEKAAKKPDSWDFSTQGAVKKNVPVTKQEEEEGELEELEAETGYGSDYKAFIGMSTVEKVAYLNNNKQRLNELASYRPKSEQLITEALVDTTKDAALINHAVLIDAIRLGDDEAKKITDELVVSTNEMVKSSVYLVSEDVFNNELMNTLVQKSNGTIVQHMTRVYLNGLSFLAYYNNLCSKSSLIQKLRVSFATRYRKLYQTLLPHIVEDDIILERVFLGGMRAVPLDLYFKWAVGFLVHDIGKAGAVEYHEGEAKYDREVVIEHVKLGYQYIMNKTNYPMEASLIAGYHHEYYGDPNGYGYFRAYLQEYKKQNPNAKQDYCITYELEPMLDYQALAYFPAKVLEIIDVYDSVTDPHRAYRKSMTPEEAISMMREEFIEKQLKIDPILFDIYILYIREQQKIRK